MGLRINTNVAAIAARRNLANSQQATQSALKALGSGDRFADPKESSADRAIASHLKGQVKGLEAGQKNAEFANSFVQVAEGGLNEQSNILLRMRELAIQSASDTFSETEREFTDLEFQALASEFDRIAKTTQFGSNKLLDGTEREYEFQVGAYKGDENIVTYRSDTNTTASELNVDGLRVSDKSDALDSLETLDKALTEVSKARAQFGAVQSRLGSVINNAAIQVENLSAAHSQIADTDIAKAMSEVAKQQVLQSYQLMALRTANDIPGQALRLVA